MAGINAPAGADSGDVRYGEISPGQVAVFGPVWIRARWVETFGFRDPNGQSLILTPYLDSQAADPDRDGDMLSSPVGR